MTKKEFPKVIKDLHKDFQWMKEIKKIEKLYLYYNAILAGQAEGDENEIMEKINKICEENDFDKDRIIHAITIPHAML
jgi:hypothetical protein